MMRQQKVALREVGIDRPIALILVAIMAAIMSKLYSAVKLRKYK